MGLDPEKEYERPIGFASSWGKFRIKFDDKANVERSMLYPNDFACLATVVP